MFSYSKQSLQATDPDLWAIVQQEHQRQEEHIELIAIENYTSPGGDDRARQPAHQQVRRGLPRQALLRRLRVCRPCRSSSRSTASSSFSARTNTAGPPMCSRTRARRPTEAVFLALLKPGDTIMGMNLAEGGHLSHGMALNMSGKWFNVVSYGLNDKEEIDYDAMERKAHEQPPEAHHCGRVRLCSAHRLRALRQSRRRTSARCLMVDMAHYAGLIAAGVYPNPMPMPTSSPATTHKSLRGPRGGMILMRAGAREGDQLSAIFPGMQGGPLMHVIAAKAVAFKEALSAGVQGLPATGGQERRGTGRNAGPARPAHRLGPHREPRDAGRPARQGHDRQGRRSRAGRARTSRSTRTPSRTIPEKPIRDQRRAPGLAGDDHARLQGGPKRARSATLIADLLDHPDDEAQIARVRAAVAQLTAAFPVYG